MNTPHMLVTVVTLIVSFSGQVLAHKSNTPRLKLVCDFTAGGLFQIIQIPQHIRLKDMRITVTIREIRTENNLWQWEGVTNDKGNVDVKIKDYITFLAALGQLRENSTRGEFVLTGEDLRGVAPLTKTGCMRYIKQR